MGLPDLGLEFPTATSQVKLLLHLSSCCWGMSTSGQLPSLTAGVRKHSRCMQKATGLLLNEPYYIYFLDTLYIYIYSSVLFLP